MSVYIEGTCLQYHVVLITCHECQALYLLLWSEIMSKTLSIEEGDPREEAACSIVLCELLHGI